MPLQSGWLYVDLGVDYSFAQIGARPIKESGAEFVVRYLGGSARLTPQERDNLHAAGINILLVMEQEADQAEKGFDRGVQLAIQANDEADALGYPSDCPLLYADDRNDPDPAQEADTMRGVKSVGHRESDMYSGGNVLAYLRTFGLSPFGGWMVETWFPNLGADPFMVQLANTRDPVHIDGIGDEYFDTNLLIRPVPMWGPKGTVMPGGAPMKPQKKARGTFDMIRIGKSLDGKDRCFYWNGSYIEMEFNGTPNPEVLNFPSDALDFSKGDIPFRLVDPWTMAYMDQVSETVKHNVQEVFK